jgi:hypothetical protein
MVFDIMTIVFISLIILLVFLNIRVLQSKKSLSTTQSNIGKKSESFSNDNNILLNLLNVNKDKIYRKKEEIPIQPNELFQNISTSPESDCYATIVDGNGCRLSLCTFNRVKEIANIDGYPEFPFMTYYQIYDSIECIIKNFFIDVDYDRLNTTVKNLTGLNITQLGIYEKTSLFWFIFMVIFSLSIPNTDYIQSKQKSLFLLILYYIVTFNSKSNTINQTYDINLLNNSNILHVYLTNSNTIDYNNPTIISVNIREDFIPLNDVLNTNTYKIIINFSQYNETRKDDLGISTDLNQYINSNIKFLLSTSIQVSTSTQEISEKMSAFIIYLNNVIFNYGNFKKSDNSLSQSALINRELKEYDLPFTFIKDGCDITVTETEMIFNSIDQLYLQRLVEKKVELPTQIFISPKIKIHNITKIGNNALQNNTYFEYLGIPSSVITIGISAFSGCTGLKQITFSPKSSLTTIQSGAFIACTQITQINIPDSVTMIDDGAFSSCTRMTQINIPKSVTSIGQNIFVDCKNIIITSQNTKFITLYNILIDILNGVILSAGNFRSNDITTNTETNIMWTINNKSYYLPNNIKEIGKIAFTRNTRLEQINIPEIVTTIGSGAFDRCNILKTITFSSNSRLTSLNNYAFMDCSSLTTITLPNSLNSISMGIFKDCTSLVSIGLPTGIISIMYNAFEGCTSLTTIIINNKNYVYKDTMIKPPPVNDIYDLLNEIRNGTTNSPTLNKWN